MVEAFPIHYHGRVFRNHEHQLDLYCKFAGDAHYYKYELVMPPISTSAGLSEDDPYPAPSQYYLATGKRFIERYTPAGWAAIGMGHVAGYVDADATIDPNVDPNTDAGGAAPPGGSSMDDAAMAHADADMTMADDAAMVDEEHGSMGR